MTSILNAGFCVRHLGSAFALALIMVTSSCATAAGEDMFRWRVVDPNTQPPTPVTGADVIVQYTGQESVIVDSFSFCDRVDVVRSDEQGWFEVPKAKNRQIVVTAHKTGYAYPGPRFISNATKRELYLAPGLPREQRIKQVKSVSDAASCRSVGVAAGRLADLIGQVIAEMRPLVQDARDEQILTTLEDRYDIHRQAAERR